MSSHLGKIALMVAMSHGLRSLSRLTSPRWAGLALGLPCSTAVALVGAGADRGVEYAITMSGTSLVGLAGAVMLPVAFARAVQLGWRLPWAILLGVGSDLVVAMIVGRLLPGQGGARLGIALMTVLAATFLVARIAVDESLTVSLRRPLSVAITRVLRTVVPITCLFTSLMMGEWFGPEVSGLLSTFPGVTLTVLWLTHLESGPLSAIRMARALPAGNLGMVAFLAAFRFGCPSLGLAWGTVAAYLAAMTTLGLVVSFDGLKNSTLTMARVWHNRAIREANSRRSSRPSWPRECRKFSPLVETSAW